ncbi:transcription cofactor HES-6 isoform X2 [Dromiciops gliroides]|uniref:transcription cofactor HES-6 isoform X2 n=1 Tax=Dromiciops gliroides TaxID=33562 RepID=UPI001CC58262|nr:transcription cofactor HES-6 isoform X2 [Dromiciops gliroides]
MAPSFRPSRSRSGREEEDFWEAKGDRKARKPLVEKKRRARINESLQELRLILADAEFQMKMENAEVLELTNRTNSIGRPVNALRPATSSACTRSTPSSPLARALMLPSPPSSSTTCWSPCP